MSSSSNLLARLAEIMRRQQQQPRDLTVEDEDDIDAHFTMTEDELAAAQQRFWERIADPHGGDGIVLKEDPKTLDTCDLAGIAKYLKRGSGYGSGKLKVVVMAGAGISTSAGIPDFRSPKTGLYANLARLNLPYPEAVFDIHYFQENPLPFYTLAHELYPGNFRPTVTHSFIKLLADKGMLQMCFTQNIDTLERLAGVPADKLIEAHGSFAENHCIDCGAEFPSDEMRELVLAPNPSAPGGVNVPRCKIDGCNGLVKPDIVFFGESLPERFHESLRTLPFADLAIVMGTSLKVHPFARLPEMVSDRCPRVLMNMETAGHFERADDVIHLAPCDDAVRELCDLLGWRDELEQTWAATEGLVDTSRPVKPLTVAEEQPSKIQAAKNAVEAGNMKDLADMMANRLNLADSSSQPGALAEAEKNAEKVAESTAAVMDSTAPLAARKATATIRVSLAWVPEPAPIPDEESVLVLTAPTGQYVDIRIKLPASTDATSAPHTPESTATNPPDQIPPNSTLSWGFAGLASRTPDGEGGRWSRIVDSRTPVIDPAGEADEGQEETLPNGDTKEWGTMGGKEYVEVWRSLDVGGSPESWVSEKDKDGAGMVVRVGNWAQGVARQGGELSVFRAWLKDGKWEDVYRVGSVDMFPAVGGSKEGWKVAGAGETKL